MLSSDSSETNRSDSCRPIETPTIEIVSEQTALLLGLDEVEYTLVDTGAEDFGSSIQQTFDVVLGTLEDDKATDVEQRRASPMQRWASQLWSSDPWCILGMAPTVEQRKERIKEVADKNEQKTEESTRDCLSSDNSSEVWSIEAIGGSDIGTFAWSGKLQDSVDLDRDAKTSRDATRRL